MTKEVFQCRMVPKPWHVVPGVIRKDLEREELCHCADEQSPILSHGTAIAMNMGWPPAHAPTAELSPAADGITAAKVVQPTEIDDLTHDPVSA
jgi:hypothetical protein